MRSVRFLLMIAVSIPGFAFSLDKAFSGIAPDHQEAAQKRQAELVRQRFCTEKAGIENVVKRDLASFVLGCMDKIEKGERAITR